MTFKKEAITLSGGCAEPSAPADPPEEDRLWTFFTTFASLFQIRFATAKY
jgi:hypothetical protein